MSKVQPDPAGVEHRTGQANPTDRAQALSLEARKFLSDYRDPPVRWGMLSQEKHEAFWSLLQPLLILLYEFREDLPDATVQGLRRLYRALDIEFDDGQEVRVTSVLISDFSKNAEAVKQLIGPQRGRIVTHTGEPSLVRGILLPLHLSDSAVRDVIEALRLIRDVEPRENDPLSPGRSPGIAEASKSIPNRPSDNAFIAWRLRDLKGLKGPSAIAKEMTKQLGRPVLQGTVSRWLKQTDAYRKAGGIFPDLPALTEQPHAIDPTFIDIGERQDQHTPRQRQRRDPDAD